MQLCCIQGQSGKKNRREKAQIQQMKKNIPYPSELQVLPQSVGLTTVVDDLSSAFHLGWGEGLPPKRNSVLLPKSSQCGNGFE